jgi:hypothetical protein
LIIYRDSNIPEPSSNTPITIHLPTGDDPEEAIASEGAWYKELNTRKVTLVPHSLKILKFNMVFREMQNRQNQTYTLSHMGLTVKGGTHQLTINTNKGIVQI